MYGSDTSQIGALAATGLAVGATGQVIAGAVIAIAGFTLLAAVRVIQNRRASRQ